MESGASSLELDAVLQLPFRTATAAKDNRTRVIGSLRGRRDTGRRAAPLDEAPFRIGWKDAAAIRALNPYADTTRTA